MTVSASTIDLEALKRKLAEHAEDLAVDLFGQPSKRTKSELRWGSKGSLVVKLSGPRRGSFRSWEEDRVDPSTWPDSIRWHRRGYLIFASTSPEGEMTALQRVYVNADGTPKVENGEKIKRSLGPRRGGAVRFSGLADGPLCLAEGPETALSAWYATGYETWAALGAMGSVDLEPIEIARKIIVCRDDDARNAPSRKALRDAIRKWRTEGRTVLEILPFEMSRRDKTDLNDALVDGRLSASPRHHRHDPGEYPRSPRPEAQSDWPDFPGDGCRHHRARSEDYRDPENVPALRRPRQGERLPAEYEPWGHAGRRRPPRTRRIRSGDSRGC